MSTQGIDPSQYETALSPQEEIAFQGWKAQYAPKDSGYDYDLRGAYKAGLMPDPVTGHWPDTFKKPNHPTFSVESMYAPLHPELAGQWMGNKYVKPAPITGAKALLLTRPSALRMNAVGLAKAFKK